jgi:hypothetical protein
LIEQTYKMPLESTKTLTFTITDPTGQVDVHDITCTGQYNADAGIVTVTKIAPNQFTVTAGVVQDLAQFAFSAENGAVIATLKFHVDDTRVGSVAVSFE